MKGTRLWVQAGSPLIHGRSRAERPLWIDALLSIVLAHALMTAAAIAWSRLMVPDAEPLTLSGVVDAAIAVLPVFLVSAAVCPAAVWLIRRMGWRRSWLPAGLIGFVVSAAVYTASVINAVQAAGK